MKRRTRDTPGIPSRTSLAVVLVPAVVFATAASPSPLRAQTYGGTVSVHGSLALAGYWSDEDFRGNGVSVGGAVDFFPTSVLGLELGVDGGDHSRSFADGVEFDGNAIHVSGSALLRFSRSRVQPYVIGGAGLVHARTARTEPGGEEFESEGDALMGNLGLGAFLFVRPRVSVRPELRVVGYDASAPLTLYYRASFGIGYHF